MNGKRRVLSVILVLVMVFSLVSANVFADNEQVNHVNGCGYVCTHEHDSECGYVAASDCKHVHGEDCSYVKEVKCNCLPDNDGNIVHEDNCVYVAPVECDHVHNSDCGFVEGSRCTHKCAEDENCKWIDVKGCSEYIPTYVAQIGDVKFEELDLAIKAANESNETETIIEILADCSTSASTSLVAGKVITIKSVDDVAKNITLNGHLSINKTASLTVLNCNISTAYKIVMYNAANLYVKNSYINMYDNVTTARSGSVYYKGAIELEAPCTVTFDASRLDISNYYGSAMRWDSNSPNYKVSFINGSVLNESSCYAGFTGTLNVYVTDSTINVNSNRGNGSNGTNFYFTNATVNFDGNRAHALSATKLESVNSKVTVSNTNLNAIIAHNVNIKSSTVEIYGTKGTSYWNAGIRMYANGILNIDSTSTVNIHDNLVTGVLLQANSQMNVEEGANVVITNNYAEQTNCETKREAAQCGGGLSVWTGASANLSASTKIYNNHAALAGDDIFLQDGASIVLPTVASSVSLDDCGHAITGWYYDGYRVTDEIDVPELVPQATQNEENVVYKIDFSRWNVITSTGKNCNDQDDTYAVALENQQGQMSGILAIKAAHGPVNDTPIVINIVPAGDPVEDIPEDDVPQTDLPTEEDPSTPAGEETIPDEDAPLADAPSAVTGDATVIWLAIAMVCGMSLIYIVADSKRKED